MTVKELRTKLKKYGDNEEVVYRGISGSLEIIVDIDYGYAEDGDCEITLESELHSLVVDDCYNKFVVLVGE